MTGGDFKNSRAEVVSLVYDVKRGCEVCGEQITHGETRQLNGKFL